MMLSVVIPILNEVDQLPQLFDTLANQVGISFEVILIDGGSTDGSRELAEELAQRAAFPCRVESGPRGRGRQLNEGFKLSTGQSLLFLHADSQFRENMALAKALKFLDKAVEKVGHTQLAGHFTLRFQSEHATPSFGFYFWSPRLASIGPVAYMVTKAICCDEAFLIRSVLLMKLSDS